MALYICIKFHENIFERFQSYRRDTIFIGKISKGHNSIKMYVELQCFFTARCLVMIYLCIIYLEKIPEGI